jgi:hypothetical protein
LWWQGINIACDAGTYLYSGEGIWRNGLAQTAVHNTVTVDRQDQMKRLSRFTWTGWARGKVLKSDKNIWQGQHDGYKPVIHGRTVLALEGDRWLVVDHLQDVRPHHYALHWLFGDGEYGVQQLASGRGLRLKPAGHLIPAFKVLIQMGLVGGNGNFSVIRADLNSTRGWRSQYYGDKIPAISTLLEANQRQACFWTFFGSESDGIKLSGNTLTISSREHTSSINLDQFNK